MSHRHVSRRVVLGGAAAVSGLAVAGGALTSPAHAAVDGFGLRILEHRAIDHRLEYFRFGTGAVSTNPAVNVLLPDGYHGGGKRYPVLYLFHGGNVPGTPDIDVQDFRWWHRRGDVFNTTAWKDVIVVMPDGGNAGWYSNPVQALLGPRNWETFHMSQLLPWVDANFRTFPEFAGRAVAGFSMGGFGALKYAAKYFGHFSSVTSFSGPASLRRESGAVAQWAQTSSAVDLGLPGLLYGVPWDEGRVTADNAVQNIERYRGKRVTFYSGTGADVQEPFVFRGHQEFSSLLNQAGIGHGFFPYPGGHGGDLAGHLRAEIGPIVAHLRRAG